MSTWSKIMLIPQALQAGWTAARRVFDDPASMALQEQYYQRIAEYDLLWSYYSNSLFDRFASLVSTWQTSNPWPQYKAAYNLYRNIRPIYNPTRRLVEFYAGNVYPGILSPDADELPDAVPLAIPLSKKTPPALKEAIGQFWQWSNWQAKKAVMVRYGAALGSVLVEVIDDIPRGKVSGEILWPGFVADLQLDSAGNVKAYTIAYNATDEENGTTFLYEKRVDGQAFRYFRDGAPFDYGQGTMSVNQYGFVPAVWCKHLDTGGLHGSPAVSGSMGKVDELNNLASHTHDQIHKVIGAPLVLWTSGAVSNLFSTKKRGATEEMAEPSADQESVLMLKGPQGGSVDTLAGNLDIPSALAAMDRLIGEVEKDHPELTYYEQLRAMSQVTGPAASRLVGDVARRIEEAQASYDTQSIKLFQMAVAIAGERANSGAWGRLTPQQQKFLPFGLDSYTQGDLDLSIVPRPLLVPTKLEQAQERLALWQGIQAAKNAGVPPEISLAEAGWTAAQLARLKASEPPPLPPAGGAANG